MTFGLFTLIGMPSIDQVKKGIQLIKNMGLRYVTFRVKYALQIKLGLLKKKFPTNPEFKTFVSLKDWKTNTPLFFFDSRNELSSDSVKVEETDLKNEMDSLKKGVFTFFSSFQKQISKDWLVNPDTQYKYDGKRHWVDIQDIDKEAGDIKYVWEKARFSWVYTVVRYDVKTSSDHSDFVFNEILHFIEKNPLNQGPNYKCSQEISLRVMNWIFVLNFYKDSKNLTSDKFDEIINAIYWQLDHVYKNINFSRIAVRNNHAITETLMLYLAGLLLPFIPESKKWSRKGKKWFEEEVTYQVYEDGTFLQFSMNYHRVVVQLMTWAIRLSEIHNDKLSSIVYQRAEKTLAFLGNCTNPVTGWLPNYGANDGAMFFKLNSNDYRDYRPQLEGLARVLGKTLGWSKTEDWQWYVGPETSNVRMELPRKAIYKKGGYFVSRENNELTFLRCGSHRDRPSQADNLHLDLWYKNQNIMRDAGSYKYNTSEEEINYFFGTSSHNTIMLDGKNQMLKGPRFIWYNWTQSKGLKAYAKEGFEIVEGKIDAFAELKQGIEHHRKVSKKIGEPYWVIEDVVTGFQGEIEQVWNPNDSFFDDFTICATDSKGDIKPIIDKGWVSDYYGRKEPTKRIIFKSVLGKLITTIQLK